MAESAVQRRPGERGRPSTLLVPTRPRLVGVLTVTTAGIRAAVADYRATLLGQHTGFLPRQSQDVLPAACALLAGALADLERTVLDLDCVVVGVPAPFEASRGTPTFRLSRPALLGGWAPPQFDGWLRADPARRVQDALGRPALAENDANLGALGEKRFGAARPFQHVVYLKVSEWGFGAGLLLNDGLHRGAAGFAGEVAHLHVRDDGPLCRCGGRGCLSGVLGRSLVESVQPAYDQRLSFPDILELAERGDPGPRRILHDAGYALGRALAGVCTILDPEAIVLDSALGGAAEHLASGMHAAVDRDVAPVVAEHLEILTGALPDAEVAGAVALAQNR